MTSDYGKLLILLSITLEAQRYCPDIALQIKAMKQVADDLEAEEERQAKLT